MLSIFIISLFGIVCKSKTFEAVLNSATYTIEIGENETIITIEGDDDSIWYGLGFGGSDNQMTDVYAVIYDSTGLQERKLEDSDPGTQLKDNNNTLWTINELEQDGTFKLVATRDNDVGLGTDYFTFDSTADTLITARAIGDSSELDYHANAQKQTLNYVTTATPTTTTNATTTTMNTTMMNSTDVPMMSSTMDMSSSTMDTTDTMDNVTSTMSPTDVPDIGEFEEFTETLVLHNENGVKITVTILADQRAEKMLIRITGPMDKWFGVGFGTDEMSGAYAVVVENGNEVNERELGNYAAGMVLDTDSESWGTIEDNEVIAYLMRDYSSDVEGQFDFTEFLNCMEEDIDIIYAFSDDTGTTLAFHGNDNYGKDISLMGGECVIDMTSTTHDPDDNASTFSLFYGLIISIIVCIF